MKTLSLLFGALLLPIAVFAGTLPVITRQPTNQIVAPNNNATFSVTASGATGYQWRFNGTNIPGATASSLLIANAQLTNAGYYMVVVQNGIGWVPSQLAYLSVVDVGPSLPFSNQGNPAAIANYDMYSSRSGPITDGLAQMVAGPALDQMQPVGTTMPVPNGYFGRQPLPTHQTIPTVAIGQPVYFRVDISYPANGGTMTQPSTVLKLVGSSDTSSLRFPAWEWPEPIWVEVVPTPPTNVVLLAGQTFSLESYYVGYGDFGVPTLQWRKDGTYVSAVTNFNGSPGSFYGIHTFLTITNVQAADAGVYDAEVHGNYWFIGPKTYLSVTTNTQPAVLKSPRILGTNFVCDVDVAPGANYIIAYSTNLTTWYGWITVSNGTGTVTFSDPLSAPGWRYYRSLPPY